MTEEDFKKTELEKIVDEASRILLEMNNEVEGLKIKFGTESKLYKVKRFDLDSLIVFHEIAVVEINSLRHALKLAKINSNARNMAEELLVESLATKIHSDNLAEYLNLLSPAK